MLNDSAAGVFKITKKIYLRSITIHKLEFVLVLIDAPSAGFIILNSHHL